MKKTELRRYAKLIVWGAGVKKGMPVQVTSTLDQPEFTTIVVEEAYKAGASSVVVRWNHAPTSRLDVKYQSEEELTKVPEWRIVRASNDADQMPARISLRSVNPDGMKNVDQGKSLMHKKAVNAALKPHSSRRQGKDHWCLAGVPNKAWAKKVFPGVRTSVAEEKLWQAILQAARCTEDPIAEWQAHNADLRARATYLNDLELDSVRFYASNGTDLTMKMIPEAMFLGGAKTAPSGVQFNANIPTEECFITPHKYKTEGVVYSTMPWCWNGQIAEGCWLRFHEGKVVEYGADSNVEMVEKMLNLDEGACYLGEFALVPWESPINQSGVLFYDTLYDENARCHLALGRGFNNCIKGFAERTKEEITNLGVNDSMLHHDFMIGTEDLNVDGITASGEIIPIFRNGTWAF